MNGLGVAARAVLRELMLETQILWRRRRQLVQRLADVAFAQTRFERVVKIDVARLRVPRGIDIFRIDRAAAQVPAETQVRIGRAQVEVSRQLRRQLRLPCRVEFVHVIVGRIEPVLTRCAQRAHQTFDVAARPLAIAPHELVAVLLVEPLFLSPDVMAAFLVVDDKRRPLRFHGHP